MDLIPILLVLPVMASGSIMKFFAKLQMKEKYSRKKLARSIYLYQLIKIFSRKFLKIKNSE
jgi:hypothetical protein